MDPSAAITAVDRLVSEELVRLGLTDNLTRRAAFLGVAKQNLSTMLSGTRSAGWQGVASCVEAWNAARPDGARPIFVRLGADAAVGFGNEPSGPVEAGGAAC